MAEIIGVVSAGIGLAAFVVQISGNIRRLRETRDFVQNKAAAEVGELIGRLEFLRQILLSLDDFQGHKIVELAIGHCQLVYSSVDATVDKVVERLSKIEGSKLSAVRKAGDLKDEVAAASEKVDFIINEINCALTRDLHHIVATNLPATAAALALFSIPQRPPAVPLSEPDIATGSSLVPITSMTSEQCALTSPILARRTKVRNCIDKHCHCSCHLTHNTSRRFWAFEYTPLSIVLKPCDYPGCTGRRYRWNLRLSLTRYGLPISVVAGLEFISAAGTYSLRPALTAQGVVKYTSPGFQTLWLFQRRVIPLQQAKERLLELRKADPSMRYHLNPSGQSYVEVMILYSYSRLPYLDYQSMLTFLVSELDLPVDNLGQDFLMRYAASRPRDQNHETLNIILKHGFDPGAADYPVFDQWRRATRRIQDAILRESGDPFFIQLLAKLSVADPGFGGLTPLQDAVLKNSTSTVTSLGALAPAHRNEVNFLGQTPLHLAVSNVEIARALVQSGHDPDAVDGFGRTPLMYAAALGYTETARFLIYGKANPLMTDKVLHLNFISHAAYRGNWDLIIDVLEAMRHSCSPGTYHRLIYYSIWKLSESLDTKRRLYFVKLINCCDDVNRTNVRTGNTLLHYVSHLDEANALVRGGFAMFDHRNGEGRLPIHEARYSRGGAELLEFYLNHGTDVNAADENGRTVIFYLISELGTASAKPTILNAINACLAHGANILKLDSCRCACSGNGGCIAVASCKIWRRGVTISVWIESFIWATELLCILEEHGGEDLTKRLLLTLLRGKHFDDLKMTHVCCHENFLRSITHPPGPVEVDRILNEECELIEQLDQEMERLEQQPLGYLWSMWMSISKVGYERVRKRVQKMKESHRGKGGGDRSGRRSNVTGTIEWEVSIDYKLDKISGICFCNPNLTWRGIARGMQKYADWLRAEYALRKQSSNSPAEADAWYNRRLSWFRELIEPEEIEIEGF
ncbi:hypothetical protein BJY00DRAFT_109793 [Aspergillus carlsbadensis]|nr:hypothetical protein BJY00DRAFT_109793 [Aspergillus carlsbadensis]